MLKRILPTLPATHMEVVNLVMSDTGEPTKPKVFESIDEANTFITPRFDNDAADVRPGGAVLSLTWFIEPLPAYLERIGSPS